MERLAKEKLAKEKLTKALIALQVREGQLKKKILKGGEKEWERKRRCVR